jgi:hypothetical protein
MGVKSSLIRIYTLIYVKDIPIYALCFKLSSAALFIVRYSLFVEMAGFEPTTLPFERGHSVQLSYISEEH